MQTRTRRLGRGIAALAVIVTVTAGVPLLLLALDLVPHHLPTFHEISSRLSERDDGQLVVVVLAAAAWVCWALFTVSLIPEIAAAITHRPAVRLPAVFCFQGTAAALVTAITLGVTLTHPASEQSAASLPPLPGMKPVGSITTGLLAPVVRTPRTEVVLERLAEESQYRTHIVEQRDSLWDLADSYLGDPLRYVEIVRLNQGIIGLDNDLTVGTELRIPAADHVTVDRVRVQPGDTLWGISQQATGSGPAWHEIWNLNRGRIEPGHEHFDDPDLIKPGWTIDVPARHEPVGPESPLPPSRPEPEQPPTSSPTSSPGPAPTVSNDRSHHHAGAQAVGENRYTDLEVGGLLAASLLGTLVLLRRRRFARRRLGRVITALPSELAPLEHVIAATGRPGLTTVEFLNLALRDLAERTSLSGRELPDAVGASVNGDRLELILARDHGQPPAPWLASGPRTWTLQRSVRLDPVVAQRLAPYPCLVSVGVDDAGTEYLLDLEHLGALRIAGDPERCVDLARYLVAELANSAWADHVTVTTVGFGTELIGANPGRLQHEPALAAAIAEVSAIAGHNRAAAADSRTDVLDGRLDGTAGDLWMPHVLLIAPSQLDHADVDAVVAAVDGPRSAVAVVIAGTATTGADAEVSAGGVLTIPILSDLPLRALRLTADDATDIAQAIALERGGDIDEPVPASTGEQPWQAMTDAAGALLVEHTVARGEAPSVLPADDTDYESRSVVCAEDLAVLAPAVPDSVRRAVRQSDPALDDDLAAWLDPASGIARLHVLGPVRLTAHGRQLVRSHALCTELTAYLWMHRSGVSSSQLANDIWPRRDYTGSDSNPKTVLSELRHYLGTDPRTGNLYLPRATRGSNYRLNETFLTDWDLFFRLRRRGTLLDLIAALDLVTGRPWSDLRPFGYAWLPSGEPYLYEGAVSEVALTIATNALEQGDTGAAESACRVALNINPEDDLALMSLAKVHEQAGRPAELAAVLRRAESLEDPPKRMIETMQRSYRQVCRSVGR